VLVADEPPVALPAEPPVAPPAPPELVLLEQLETIASATSRLNAALGAALVVMMISSLRNS
jgi:hypothetical protein